MWLSIVRTIKFSVQDITRYIWLTIATVTILILALFSVNMLLTVQVISQNALEAIKQKVDISLYLKTDAADVDINNLRTRLSTSNYVKKIDYISKADALNSFREKNQNNPEILAALTELGRNPLSPSLVIYPNNTDESPKLIEEIKKIDSPIIESRDFSDNTLLLEKINVITKKINQVGLFLILIFGLTSMLVAYNSIRVAIYTHRREIEIMRLVGASNFFVYMPYIASAIFYALFSVVLIIIIFFPFLGLLQPYLEVFFTGYNINLVSYFWQNFFLIFSSEFLIVALISVLSSWLAIRRYAKV